MPIKNADSDKSLAELIPALESQTTFNGELEKFLDIILVSPAQVTKNWMSLRTNLFSVLRSSFPCCEIYRFGSTYTDLAFKSSDFDIFLDIREPIYDDDDNDSGNVPKFNESGKQQFGWTPRTIFREVKNLLYKRRSEFEGVVPIPRARTPIIKFHHVPTSMNCDISFKNGLGLVNSQLINHLLGLDERLRPLVIIIKYWGKIFEITGQGKFTNYAMILLIIFYLQQPEVKILPTVSLLKQSCPPEYHCNWQVNFDRTSDLPPTTNKSTLVELLTGFFDFYHKFPFAEKVICLLDGCAHARDNFTTFADKEPVSEKKEATSGKPEEKGTVVTPVCLQDPFELNLNITAAVSAKVLGVFQNFCTVSGNVCRLAIDNKETPVLLKLFTTLPAQPTQSGQSQNNLLTVTINSKKTLTAGLPNDLKTRSDIADENQFIIDHWYSLVQKLSEECLRRVFKLDLQPIIDDHDVKQQKVAETSDVHSKDNNKIVLECSGSHNVVGSRKSKSCCLDPGLSVIDKEAIISEDIIANQAKNKSSTGNSKIFHFRCTMQRATNPVRFLLKLENQGSTKNQFRQLGSFIATKLPSIIDQELIRMLQYSKQ